MHREAEIAEFVWKQIWIVLEKERDQIYEEIRGYPPPIAACDEQFNYLLKQRAQVSRELARMNEAARKREKVSGTFSLSSFLETIHYILERDPGSAKWRRVFIWNPLCEPEGGLEQMVMEAKKDSRPLFLTPFPLSASLSRRTIGTHGGSARDTFAFVALFQKALSRLGENESETAPSR